MNDDWDEACARCTAPKGSSSVIESVSDPQVARPFVEVVSEPAAATAAVQGTEPDQPRSAELPPAADATVTAPSQSAVAPSPVPAAAAAPVEAPPAELPTPPADALPPPQRRSAVDSILTALIVCLVFGLVVVAWLAVQSGMLKQMFSKATSAQPAATDTQYGAEEGETAAELPPGDPLAMLQDKDVPKLKLFRGYEEVLRDVDAALAGHAVTGGTEPGTLSADSEQWLASLEPLADRLVAEYEDFETVAAQHHEGQLEKYKIMLREQFAARMHDMLEPLAQARSRDLTGNLQAYMIGDRFIAVLEKHGQVDSSSLKDRWLSALHAQRQLGLDLQNAEVYKQLEARLAALTELHQDYSRSLAEAPPYKVRNGYIDETASQLLTLYNDLAVNVEQFVAEFEEYSATLDPELESDRRKELVDSFIDLAQEDHLYAFTETYKMYSKDRELTHPTYQQLAERVAFVKQHWPDIEGRYRMVYTQYELAWDARYRNKDGAEGGGGGGSDLIDDNGGGGLLSPGDDQGGLPQDPGANSADGD